MEQLGAAAQTAGADSGAGRQCFQRVGDVRDERIAGIFAGLPWGVEGVAAGFTLATLSLAYPLFVVPGKLVQAPFRLFVRATAASLLAAVCLGACLHGVARLLPQSWSPFLNLAVLVPLGVGGYLALVWVTKAEAFFEFLAMVRGGRRP